MTGMNVLSDSFRGGIKLKNSLSSEEKGISDGAEDAAAAFAALLGGFISPSTDLKGQDYKEGQNSENMQSEGDLLQCRSDFNGYATGSGYENFAFLFQSLPVLQSELPAGKDANSGASLNQGMDNPSVNGLSENLKTIMMELISLSSDESLASTGMSMTNSQGSNLESSESDIYRQLITQLLESLSGEIINSSSGEREAQVSRQELTRIIQGWMAESDELSKGPLREPEKSVQTLTTVMNKIENLMSGLGNLSPTIGTESKNINQVFKKINQDLKSESSDSESVADTKTKTAIQRMINSLGVEGAKDSGQGLDGNESAPVSLKEIKVYANPEQRFERASILANKPPEDFHLPKEDAKADVQKSGELVFKDTSYQPTVLGAGNVANLSEGKHVNIPVWQQVYMSLREEVMTKQQTLKELDIQLHPEDLGKIRVLLRWEGGQVHLQVQASEAATGQLLQNQHSELRQNLISNGVNCGSLSMGTGGEQQQEPHEHTQRSYQQQWVNFDEDTEASNKSSNFVPVREDKISRLNVMA